MLLKRKKLCERKALVVFLDIIKVVKGLHEKNIVHRDLKLGNIVLNKRTRRITITNFCLGKHLVRGDDLLNDQRGSPAYISPDVLSGRPYSGKASDMWALGVVLYTMLYGQFPFYDSVPQELFRKIKTAEYVIPKDKRVSEDTILLLHRLLMLDSSKRATADDALIQLQTTVNSWYCSTVLHDVQIVPDIDHQQDKENATNSNTTSNGNPSSRKSSTESMDSVILVQTPKHLKQPHRHSTRYSHHRHQQELLRRIQSMTSPPPTLRRVSRSTPSLTESDLEAYARGIRSIVPL